MLVNSRDLLLNAKRENKVIFQFNINNLEWTKHILEKCNKLKKPVILGVSEGAIKHIGGYNVVYSMCSSLIEDLDINIDVCLHLDHGKSYESCKKAIDAGFTSVMIDMSTESLENNITVTKQVVEYAKEKNVTVEAELGLIGNQEIIDNQLLLKDCLEFVNITNIDSLAPSVGTVHGIYKGALNINYKLIKDLADNLDIPLVLHGGSGLSNDILKKCVINGITKININSDLQYVWSQGVRKYLIENEDVIDPRKIIESGMDLLENEIALKMNINN